MITLKSHFCNKKICTLRNVVMDVITFTENLQTTGDAIIMLKDVIIICRISAYKELQEAFNLNIKSCYLIVSKEKNMLFG